MILYEYEGKKLLFDASIDIPQSQLIESADTEVIIKPPCVLKAQVLSGKRADVGGIVIIRDENADVQKELKDLFGETINKEKVDKILVEKMIEYETEYYFSISYDTDTRSPLITFSESGGTGIEGRSVKTYQIDILTRDVLLQNSEDKEITDLGIPNELHKKLS